MGARGPLPQNKPTLQFKAGVPAASAFLSEEARAEFTRVVEELAAIPGHLQQVDLSVVETYSQAYADRARLEAEIRKEGETLVSDKGNAYMNPKVGVLSTVCNRLKDSSARLGFSPSDRARVNAKATPAKNGKANALDEFI